MNDDTRQSRSSACDRCGGEFSALVDGLAYFSGPRECQSCGAGPHWERGAATEAHPTPWGREYVVVQVLGGIRLRTFPRREQLPNPLWDGLDASYPRPPEPDSLYPRPEYADLKVGLNDSVVAFLAPRLTATAAGFADTDGTWFPASLIEGNGLSGSRKRRLRLAGPRRLELSAEAASRNEFLAAGGWHVRKSGATGNPRGRQRIGVRDPKRIEAELEVLLGDHSIDEMRATIRRGPIKAHESSTYDGLARIVYQLTSPPQPVRYRPLANFLGCSISTITALKSRGSYFEQKPPNEGRTVMPMMPTIASDEQLARDAARLINIEERFTEELSEIRAIAERLRKRFPTSQEIAAAVDDLLARTLA